MSDVNYLAVLLAALSAFLLGVIWYSVLFARRWARLIGQGELKLRETSLSVIVGSTFLLSLVAAYAFAIYLGPAPELDFALRAGFTAGLCWVAASLGINALFERRPFGLWLINAGYFTLLFTLFGLILSVMG